MYSTQINSYIHKSVVQKILPPKVGFFHTPGLSTHQEDEDDRDVTGNGKGGGNEDMEVVDTPTFIRER